MMDTFDKIIISVLFFALFMLNGIILSTVSEIKEQLDPTSTIPLSTDQVVED